MARTFKFYKCQKQAHILCVGIIGEKDNPLSMICDCECHEREKEMLEQKGLVKLTEECGELIQIASKKMTRIDSDEHWDNNGKLSERLENEIADVQGFPFWKPN